MRKHRKTLTLIIASLCVTNIATAQDDWNRASHASSGRIGDADLVGLAGAPASTPASGGRLTDDPVDPVTPGFLPPSRPESVEGSRISDEGPSTGSRISDDTVEASGPSLTDLGIPDVGRANGALSDGAVSDAGVVREGTRLTDLATGGIPSWTDEFDNEEPTEQRLKAFPTSFEFLQEASSGSVGDAAAPATATPYLTTDTACAPVSCAAPTVGLGWLQFDSLLWWGRGLTGSPVILGGDSPSAFPTTPIAGGQDNPIGTDLYLGLRADTGFWLDDCQNYGVGGRVWGFLTDATATEFGPGGNSTGIGFFNTSLNQPDVYLVNIDTNGFGANTGTISVLSDLDVISGELYGRALLMGDRNNRTDLLGGYTFLRLDSAYVLQSSVLDGVTNAPPPVGSVTTITDTFATSNEFHGGHLGLSTNMTRGRVGFGLSGKVALGNMRSTSKIHGLYELVPPAPNVPTTENRGLFAQSSNSGTFTQDNFTFIPEVNARMRYQLGRFQLGVGYSLVLLPTVALGAGQVDQNIDVFSIGTQTPPTSPVPSFHTETFFLHGLDLGLSVNF